MDLAGRRIAITRRQPGELGRLLAELGADIVHVPLIEIADPADGGVALASALTRLASFEWLVVTSANGARRVGAAAARSPDVRLAAVGTATAEVLEELAGRPVDLVPTVQRVEGLLVEFPTGSSRVLVAQADRAGSELADGLAATGHDVESVVAYRTIARPPTEAERASLAGVDAVVFASGSAVDAWCEAGHLKLPPVVVAIGPSTERAARSRGIVATHVSADPSPTAIADGIVSTMR